MATISTLRTSHQNHDDIRVGHREPFAGPIHRNILNELSRESIAASQATTQAAYLLRLSNIRRLVKSL